MWKILNKLFGWDYVVVSYGYNSVILRVKKFPSGDSYIKIYGDFYMLCEDEERLVAQPVVGGYRRLIFRLT